VRDDSPATATNETAEPLLPAIDCSTHATPPPTTASHALRAEVELEVALALAVAPAVAIA
jgi:hypothetical protein